MDIDSPLDLLLLEGRRGAPVCRSPTTPRRGRCVTVSRALRGLAADPGAELLVAGRTSAADLRWLERSTRSRTRALVEERGLADRGHRRGRGPPQPPPARSLLGELLDRDGPGSLGRHVAALCDGALLDSRVLMAHRHGADERGWPPAEDRFASDLLLPGRVRDPWLADLTAAAARRRSPSCSVATASSVPGSASRSAAGPGPRQDRAVGSRRRPARAAAGYRREALPDPDAVGEDSVLADAIRAEIAERRPDHLRPVHGAGPLRARPRLLPAPGAGTRDAGADFLTAPEAHPIFGAAIGRLLEQAWDALGRPSPFTVTEPGPARARWRPGSSADSVTSGHPCSRRSGTARSRWRPRASTTLRERLAADGLGGSLSAMGSRPTAAVGAVVANEVLDALPVHRVWAGTAACASSWSRWTRRFAWLEAEPSTPALAGRLATEGVTLGDGHVTEICLALDPWLADATRHLTRGLLILVDYAAEPSDLHGATRPDGTLRAFARHAVGSDPFRHVGRQDLTATVDLAAVRSAAVRAGLDPVGETTQAELLARVGTTGLTDAYLRRPGATLQEALALRSAVARLMDTRGMGGFRVLVLGRGLPEGFALPALERVTRPGA